MDRLLSVLAPLQSQAPEELPVDMETLMMISLVMTVVFLVLAVGVGYWVHRDASRRENNELVWAGATGLMTFLFLPIGIVLLIAYFVLRSDVVGSEPKTPKAAGDW